MNRSFKINNTSIGYGHPVYIIAELSANHNHSFENAVELIHAAQDCGANAVKIQTYTADTMTIDCSNEYFKIGKGTIWEGMNLYQLYQQAYTPWEWHDKLKKAADDIGVDFFSTPFDASSTDFLEKLNVPAYKIASFELTDIPLIKKIASKGKPVIMSTGMASFEEIKTAVETIKNNGNPPLALMKCTSAYPSPVSQMNLNTIPDMMKSFGTPIGLSDHSTELAVPLTAVVLGASIIEKHFTISRTVKGPDSSFSLEPAEFKEMVRAIRVSESARGSVNYEPTQEELHSKVFRRSIFAVENIKKGEPFSYKNIRIIRPAYGLPPAEIDNVIGRKASMDIERGTPLKQDMIGD